MTDMVSIATPMIKRHEGLKLELYHCTAGRATIGYGHNLEAKGVSKAVAELMYQEDFSDALADARFCVPCFDQLDPVRQAVIVDMAFNLGRDRLLKFKKFLAAVIRGDYVDAAEEMKNSAWYTQVGHRSEELHKMMLTGKTNESE